MIGIVNYGMGNLASVKNALDYLDIKSSIIDDPLKISHFDKIVLPGVGAFGMAMKNLNSNGFTMAIKEFVIGKKKPILGICLGMQLLMESSSEHGINEGLGIINGHVLYFGNDLKNLPIPHMGWNEVEPLNQATLFKENSIESSYYFVHSYYCNLQNTNQVAGTTEYGIKFHSSLEFENIFGCQFHPEKSQKSGLNIYKNFDSL